MSSVSQSLDLNDGQTVDLNDVYAFQSVDDEGLNTPGIPIRTRQSSGLIASIRTLTSSSLAGWEDKIYALGGDRLDHCVFVKYLTSSWAKSSQYVWGEANTATWSFTGGATFGEKVRVTLGLSKSRTTTYSASVYIPAISSKNSKLAFGSDYFMQNYTVNRSIINDAGIVTSIISSYDSGYTYTPTENTYLYIVYQ